MSEVEDTVFQLRAAYSQARVFENEISDLQAQIREVEKEKRAAWDEYYRLQGVLVREKEGSHVRIN